MAQMRWGMIGSSGWADHTFGPAIARARGNRLVAVLGSTRGGADAYAARHELEAAYTDLAGFLAHPDLDAVWIASPPDLHRGQAVAALRAGKHVLCEKPMAVTAADCRAMVRSAATAGRHLSIGFNNRAHPTLQRLARLSADGRFGTTLEARVHCYFPYPSPPPPWRQQRRRSGGWAIGDVGTHLLDVLCWLVPVAPRSTRGHLSNHCWGFQTDDHAQVSVIFRNGVVGSITACTGAAGGTPRVELYGTDGYFILSGGLFGAPGELEIGYKGKAPKREPIAAVDTYRSEVEAFARQAAGRPTTLATGADGALNIALVAAARGW